MRGALVCGLPSSGNRLVQRLLERHGFEVLLWHGGSDLWKDWEREGRPKFAGAVMPVREAWVKSREKAALSHHMPWWERHGRPSAEDFIAHYRENVLGYVARRSLPLLVVSYRDIVTKPEAQATRILKHVGVPWWRRKGWGEEIVDGDAKYA